MSSVDVAKIHGKRLVSERDEWLHHNSPGSGYGYTLPAGKPSPVIESYILQGGGYYQVKTEDGKTYYIKDTSWVDVVEENAADQSSFFSGLWYLVSDPVRNTLEYDTRQAGHLKEGFSKATKDLASSFGLAGTQLKYLLFGIIALAAVVLLSNLKS